MAKKWQVIGTTYTYKGYLEDGCTEKSKVLFESNKKEQVDRFYRNNEHRIRGSICKDIYYPIFEIKIVRIK